ncbi:hypothetical protein M426DRAFT_217949 [Hypoxylon sp. CI-4A]|nr:hypothetical protein M426DRAFT_217949 [Hypoxylon sp. CI-4A]
MRSNTGSSYTQRSSSKLSREDALKASRSPALEEAAASLLCRQYHGNQQSNIARQWRTKLEDKAAHYDDDSDSDDSSSTSSYSSHTFSWGSEKKSKVKKEETEDDWEALFKRMEAFARQNARFNQELRRRLSLEDDRKEKEEQRRRREQKEKKEQEEQKKQKEQKEQEERAERQRREQKAREEATRERARLAKEKREREAQQKAEKEAAEWRSVWKRYSNAWIKDEDEDLSAEDIPWPVKSGLQSDVNEANVNLFFSKAPPETLVDTGDRRFKFISAQNKRWHTDKVMQRFGQEVANGAAKSALGVVANVLVELRQKARKER